ncbi:hypothetical protein GIB67_031574 [Kingdonia uniflora]|uniref:DNA-directed RNA polymerase n=1 Tax=Kingdonia uniflora TaxID=39325 RepID=A0A7J7PBN5_9MAGN|nr:hypothetical protein GIB67_031574 [Kingdonia uniflora]
MLTSKCIYSVPLEKVKLTHRRKGKLAKPRQLHNSQWGMMYPAETPEGHSSSAAEAFSNQVAEKQMPVYQRSSKILYRVIDVQLKVKVDTNEVFAQVTLLPKSKV